MQDEVSDKVTRWSNGRKFSANNTFLSIGGRTAVIKLRILRLPVDQTSRVVI